MSHLDLDTVALICKEISNNGTLSDLDSVASVCRSWRIAALPYLFYSVQIDLSLDQKEQLQYLHSFLLNEHSPCRPFVRELRVQGDQHELLDRYLNLLVNGISSFHRLTHFSWCFQGNIPAQLLKALDDRCDLLQLNIYLPPDANREFFDGIHSASATLSLIVQGDIDPDIGSGPPKRWYFLNPPSYPNFPLARRGERAIRSVSRAQPGSSGPRLDSLMFYRCVITRWEKDDQSTVKHSRGLRKLSLVNCDHPGYFKWQLYPPSLKILEILDPVQSHDVVSDQYIRRGKLAPALSHFCNLEILNLQNVGGPICQVLLSLCENGKKLKVLKLHDQDIEGVDRCHRIDRYANQSEYIECHFHKLLAYVCPNVETLSIDVTPKGLEGNNTEHFVRGPSFESIPVEPILEELAQMPTLSVAETLRSLDSLRSLRIRTSILEAICNEQSALAHARRMWSATLECFTFVAAIPSWEVRNEVEGTVDGDNPLPRDRSAWRIMSEVENGTVEQKLETLFVVEKSAN
ncbi:MAG: hypothetical protein Q9181_007574 [Wetmoreana brouardii]